MTEDEMVGWHHRPDHVLQIQQCIIYISFYEVYKSIEGKEKMSISNYIIADAVCVDLNHLYQLLSTWWNSLSISFFIFFPLVFLMRQVC